VTRAPGRPHASPNALREAIVARANTAARANPRFNVQQLLRQFAYARLLARVFTLEPENWVLKGGVSLLARLPNARHSLDVDLWGTQHSLAEAERALERASAVDLGDHTSFDVGAWRERRDEEARPLAQATVHCRIGVRKFVSFGVDLVGGPFPGLEPEPAPPLRPLEVPGLRDAPLRVYPLAATVADKLSGIFTRHGERLSTRYRDLVDLVTISLSQRLAARDVHVAVHEELGRQGLAVPAEFAVPDAVAWETAYRAYAEALPHLESIGFEEAVALVKAFLDPVLGGRTDGWWRPEGRAWEP
jgi:Nucleotidyl transferase AbiEii toxin, Type IV TA system